MKYSNESVNCPNCRNASCHHFYSLHEQPVSENILYINQTDALQAQCGDIELFLCEHCGLVFNWAFEPHKLDYGVKYKYTLPTSTYFEAFINELAEDLIETYNLKHKHIVEIGCGKGAFLNLLCKLGNNSGVGYDTSYDGPLEANNEKINFVREYFSPKAMKQVPDIICCRQVIEHITNPGDLISTVKSVLSKDTLTTLFFETPDFGWILKNMALWDIYYEHCSYFTEESLIMLFTANGFKILRNEKIFNEQYLRIDARFDLSLYKKTYPKISANIVQTVNKFKVQAKKRLTNIRSKSKDFSKKGSWVIWGGAAKGVTFCNLVKHEIGDKLHVVDINPIRQGKFVPLSGNPIISPDKLVYIKPHTILIMNGNYQKEIEVTLKNLGIMANVICVDDL